MQKKLIYMYKIVDEQILKYDFLCVTISMLHIVIRMVILNHKPEFIVLTYPLCRCLYSYKDCFVPRCYEADFLFFSRSHAENLLGYFTNGILYILRRRDNVLINCNTFLKCVPYDLLTFNLGIVMIGFFSVGKHPVSCSVRRKDVHIW